jgi:hypothetical protein
MFYRRMQHGWDACLDTQLSQKCTAAGKCITSISLAASGLKTSLIL